MTEGEEVQEEVGQEDKLGVDPEVAHGGEEKEYEEEQLGVDPGVAEAIARCGPLLGYHLQHRQQEMGEVAGVFMRPSVLFYQDVEQRPRLQLGDVPQLACRGQLRAELLGDIGMLGTGEWMRWRVTQTLTCVLTI